MNLLRSCLWLPASTIDRAFLCHLDDNRFVLERVLPIEGRLDLRATLRPLHGVFRSDGWWFTDRTSAGPATLRVTRGSDGVRGTGWGPGAEVLIERLAGIVGLEDDPSAFTTEHPVVAALHRRNLGARMGRTGRVFAELVAAIAAQKVTAPEAHRAVRGLYRSFSEPAPGPGDGLLLPPDPEQIAAAPYWAFHEIHLEKRRADVLRTVASDALAINDLRNEAPGAAATRLAAYPGVGVWTIAETLVRSHGDADAVSVGDFHLKNSVVYHLTGRPRGTDEEMLELLEEFRPHRARVVRLLHQLGHAPKFGPRTTPRDITRY